jgi:hypothetical protein
MNNFRDTAWWRYLDESMQDLMAESLALLEEEKVHPKNYHDYSFVVFPAAKAYEGFLKKVFLDLRLISYGQYAGEHFRIGRALSPTLPQRYRSGWVYGRLINNYGQGLPLRMWEVWKEARNQTFHYFPDRTHLVTYEEADRLVKQIVKVMEECLIEFNLK